MTHNPFMRRAVELALEKMRHNGDGPFGAVVVRDGEIIAEGWNQVTATNDPSAHAEMVAIRQACAKLGQFELTDCDIYANCEPCPMCLGVMYWTRLRRLYYCKTRDDAAQIGFDDNFIYDEIALPPDKRTIPGIQLTDEMADLVFSEWAANPDKREY
jgi:tRNA(Arg) A34 adenosine deaminase TadA